MCSIHKAPKASTQSRSFKGREVIEQPDFTAKVGDRGIHGWLSGDERGLPLVYLRSIETPVAVSQGRLDLMVPYSHGEWLQSHITGSIPRLLQDEGHISLLTTRLGDVIDDAAGFFDSQ